MFILQNMKGVECTATTSPFEFFSLLFSHHAKESEAIYQPVENRQAAGKNQFASPVVAQEKPRESASVVRTSEKSFASQVESLIGLMLPLIIQKAARRTV
ncbi:unnamed protein product [Ranitomeya imitator]|uniref:Brevinin n=1 Tax=Ranitomeya imitator TaxID=111125 RepID=A0ABN9LN88_9NEOB|nr:unnamed protein product [Ranitomeya imitator]